MLDLIPWAFAGVMILATIYFARRSAGYNAEQTVVDELTNDVKEAAAQKSLAQQLAMAQLEVKYEQAQEQSILLQNQLQDAQQQQIQLQAQVSQAAATNASLQTKLEAQQDAHQNSVQKDVLHCPPFFVLKLASLVIPRMIEPWPECQPEESWQ